MKLKTLLGDYPVTAALKKGRFFAAGAEPRVAEMLRDPIVHLVMRRDRVSAGDVLSLFRGRN